MSERSNPPRPSEQTNEVSPTAPTRLPPAELPRQARDLRRDPAGALPLCVSHQTVVGTARPVIVNGPRWQRTVRLAVSVYLLTSTISGPIWGKLSDLFGRLKPILLAGGRPVPAVLVGRRTIERTSRMAVPPPAPQAIVGFSVAARFSRSRTGRGCGAYHTPLERGTTSALCAVFGLSSWLVRPICGLITDLFTGTGFSSERAVGLALPRHPAAPAAPIKMPEAARHIDYVGAGGLRRRHRPLPGRIGQQVRLARPHWTDRSRGLMVVGIAFGVLFLWIELRVAGADRSAQPVPQSLVHDRWLRPSWLAWLLWRDLLRAAPICRRQRDRSSGYTLCSG